MKKLFKEEVPAGFENVDLQNYYGEYPTAHIEAVYLDGKFIDIRTKKEVLLKNGSYVKIIVRRKDIPDEYKDTFITKKKIILPKGEIVFFNVLGTPLYFDCELLSDLVFEKTGNKLAKAKNLICLVKPSSTRKTISFSPFEVYSLNQAYFQMSRRIKPEAKSHSINIYKHFYSHNKLLEDFRF